MQDSIRGRSFPLFSVSQKKRVRKRGRTFSKTSAQQLSREAIKFRLLKVLLPSFVQHNINGCPTSFFLGSNNVQLPEQRFCGTNGHGMESETRWGYLLVTKQWKRVKGNHFRVQEFWTQFISHHTIHIPRPLIGEWRQKRMKTKISHRLYNEARKKVDLKKRHWWT